MMIKITIIRHAQSNFNAGLCKTSDELRNCGLTELGKQQAMTLNQNFDILLVSKLKRAIETYKNSNITAEKIIFTDLVRKQKEDHTLNFLEGEEIIPETPDQVRQRAREAIAFIKTLNSNNVGIISHGFFISYFLEQCGQPMRATYNVQSITFYLIL